MEEKIATVIQQTQISSKSHRIQKVLVQAL